MVEPAGAGPVSAACAGSSTRGPHQLPSGRHGLQRSFVAANQRERILSAVARAAAELGYAEMSVEAVIARAGVSRRTFYDHFKNKEDAFLGAYDAAVHQQARHIRLAYLKELTVPGRLRAGIRAYMEFMANEPEFARMCIVEVLAAGPRAIARRNAAIRMFAEIIKDNIHELAPGCPVAALAAETIVGGIHEVVFSRILADRIHELPDLADDLLTTILMLDTSGHRRPSGRAFGAPCIRQHAPLTESQTCGRVAARFGVGWLACRSDRIRGGTGTGSVRAGGVAGRAAAGHRR